MIVEPPCWASVPGAADVSFGQPDTRPQPAQAAIPALCQGIIHEKRGGGKRASGTELSGGQTQFLRNRVPVHRFGPVQTLRRDPAPGKRHTMTLRAAKDRNLSLRSADLPLPEPALLDQRDSGEGAR